MFMFSNQNKRATYLSFIFFKYLPLRDKMRKQFMTTGTPATLDSTPAVALATPSQSQSNSPSQSKSPLFRVKLCRGIIGLPQIYKDHVRSLGLRHTHQKSYLPINPLVIGNILKVKELVEVRKVNGKPIPGASYWAKGYSLLRRTLLWYEQSSLIKTCYIIYPSN